MNNIIDTKKELSAYKRAKSFAHAGRGLRLFLKTTPNAWIQLTIFIIVIFFGFYFSVTSLEWVTLILAAGIVLASEAFNTAIEIDINLTSPNYHPYARDTKDVAAGAVLISCIAAAMVGLLVFGHYFLDIWR